MSNNIYDILKKMQSLETPKSALTEGKKVCKACGEAKCKCMDEGAKPDYIDLDKDGDTSEPMKKAAKDKSKGAIAEAVARVEQQLAEKYMGFKKTVAAIKKGGSAENPEAVAAAIGRKKYGKAKFQKAAAAGKKLGEGEVNEDPFSIRPSAADRTRREMLDKFGKEQHPSLGEPGPIGRGVDKFSKAITTNVIDPLASELEKGVKKMFPPKEPKTSPGYEYPGSKKVDEGDTNEDMLSPGQKKIAKMSPPPDKIDAGDLEKLRAGKKSQKDEGNAFSGAVAKAKATGADEFSVGGKEYKVQEGFPTVADAQKRHKEQTGKTAHGTKTVTKTGVKHERDYDKDEPTGERGRPKKDKFAK